MNATARVERDNKRFRARILARMPQRLERNVARAIADADAATGYRAGNEIALRAAEYARQLPMPLSASDADMCDHARLRARQAISYPFDARARAERDGLGDVPEGEPGLRRLQEEGWQRRRTRRVMGRSVESLARDIGMVHRRAGGYVSAETLDRRREQQKRLERIMDTMEAVSDAGDVLPMQRIIEGSLANPRIRQGEMMVRIAGMEQHAKEDGRDALFLTMTCPSRFHASGQDGARNARYDGSNPREAQQYLQRVWARIRAATARAGMDVYGIRVAEPHHDGTPHWHFLIFISPEHKNAYTQIFRAHALRESPEEAGAAQHRVGIVEIDQTRGSAAGYVAKYIAKSIRGASGPQHDMFGLPIDEAAERVEAWARCWGIRQFQFIGGPRVGVWRELRRLRDGVPAGALGAAWAAADGGDWAAFMRAQESAPVGIARAWSDQWNRYGERRGWVPVGVEADGVTVPTRSKSWRFRRATRGGVVTSRSTVNNCTGGFENGSVDSGAGSAGSHSMVAGDAARRMEEVQQDGSRLLVRHSVPDAASRARCESKSARRTAMD